MSLGHAVKSMLLRNVEKVRAVNRRYATPRIEMSPAVKASLLSLRIYLLVLVALLGYKFFTMIAK